MVKKLYTRQGDDGTTSLVGGKRISKTALRLEVCGTVDELNSFLGVLCTLALNSPFKEIKEDSERVMQQVQNDLLDIGSILATPPGGGRTSSDGFSAEKVKSLELRIDFYQVRAGDLSSFVLPGGGLLGAHAHVARAVCRRAERLLWRLHVDEPIDHVVLEYINRLSDFLFAYSRWAANVSGEKEFPRETGRIKKK